jgi:hypothetical protein
MSGQGGSGGGALTCAELPSLGGEVGGTCRGDESVCNGNLVCAFEQRATIGPGIQDHPEGPDYTFEIVDLPGDYCVGALPPSPPSLTETCTADNSLACAELCGVCAARFPGEADICLKACLAEADTNSACRDGYECNLFTNACDTGCVSDDECRVFFNQNQELVYDTESVLFCNLETHRCENPGTPGASAGDSCTLDRECEARGRCLDEEFFGFPGGYCSKVRCDVDPCAGDALCANLGLGVPLCAQSCQVGSGAVEGNPATYINNTQGCNDEYTCFWVGLPDDPLGACIPGEYNDVSEYNIGDDCVEASQCISPFGQGACGDADFVCSLIGEPPGNCLTGFGCTMLDCAVPGMPEDVCGDDAECIVDSTTGLSLCLERCVSADTCLPGAACADLDGDDLTLDSVCLPFCADDTECRAGEICNNSGECTAQP